MAAATIKKWISFALKAAVTLGLIWIVLRNQDLEQVGQRLAGMSIWSVLIGMVLLCSQNFLAAKRWVIVMRLFGDTLAYRTALRFYFEGLFFNQALPSTIGGDGVRMFRVVKAGLPLGAGINGVILDRISGLFALLLIVAATQPWLYDRVEDTTARWAFAAVIACGVCGILSLLLCKYLPSRFAEWSAVRGLIGLSAGLAALFRDMGSAIGVFGLSLLGHLLMVTAIFVLAQDLALGVSFIDCLVLIPGVMLLAAAPISIAGWGVRESVMISAMALVGAPEAGSLGLSLVFGLIMVVLGLIGGAFWLANPNKQVVEADALENDVVPVAMKSGE